LKHNLWEAYFTTCRWPSVEAHSTASRMGECGIAIYERYYKQWRRQDLLRGGAKLCHGALTVNFEAGCSSCSMIDSSVTNAVLIERAVSCWHLHPLISQTTQYLDSWLSDLEVEGGGHAGDALQLEVCRRHTAHAQKLLYSSFR